MQTLFIFDEVMNKFSGALTLWYQLFIALLSHNGCFCLEYCHGSVGATEF